MSELPRHGSQVAGHGGGGKERISATSGHRSSAMARGEGSGRRERAGYREETLSSGGLEGRRLVCGENHALGSPVGQSAQDVAPRYGSYHRDVESAAVATCVARQSTFEYRYLPL